MKKSGALLTAAVLIFSQATAAAIPVAVSKPGAIALGAFPVSIGLSATNHLASANAGRCYVEIDGMAAEAPTGTGYDISIANAKNPLEPPVHVGTISFYEAVGVPLATDPAVSYEVPTGYCIAAMHGGVEITIAPRNRPFAPAKPLIGAVKLVTQ
jgi:hypothetical protein